ncbi:unnamed protein product [Spirodela intermedia]|uniref:Uncharacterized protein n=1 Tax=Spirodela intermedia TaxID=51605 RepID=A0A7I8IDI9_SPIIN|nr:unnamed protein product [Spirodela intermedia]CAA6655887.1 unnamed protein product [Spirodela intermedia]
MGNCITDGKAQVHHYNSLPCEGEKSTAQVKVRMTMKEFKDLVSQAESRKCDAGTMVMEGIRQGKWRAVQCGDAASGASDGDKTLLTSDTAKTFPLLAL